MGSDVDCYLGEIRIFAGQFAPRGWNFCDGSLLPINQYQALFALIGTTYGGDGVNTFGLPDLRGRIPVGIGQRPNPDPNPNTNWTLGKAAGTETVSLTPAQIPPHTHTWQVSGDAANSSTPAGNVLANPVAPEATPANLYVTQAQVSSHFTAAAAMIGTAGNSLPHGNMMPYISLNYIFAVTGLYPDFQ